MGYMFCSHVCIKNVTCIKRGHFLKAIDPEVHVYNTIHNGKNFLSIIDVPLIWLIRPMQLYRGTAQIGDSQTAPCQIRSEFFAPNRLHHACLSINEMKPKEGLHKFVIARSAATLRSISD